MARSKKAVKSTLKSTSSPASASTVTGVPLPFEPAPEKLEPWLSKLPKSRLYLSQIDANPKALKRQVFIVPVILNVFFVLALAYRVFVAAPWYAHLGHSIWSMYENGFKDFYGSGSVFGWFKQELWNCTIVAIDYVLLLVVAPWPWSFFFERPSNPVSWRSKVGFRERELIVRVLRGWDVNDLLHGQKAANESPFFVTRVFPGVQMDRISKTGYLLMDKDWDLDFYGMTIGQDGIDAKTFDEDAFNGKMFAFWKPSPESAESLGKWVMWNYRRDLYEKDKAASEGLDEEKGDVPEGRRAIEKFQAKLTEMGKEELFFKWIELIHFESSKPGGFTKERQIDAGAKVKQLFEDFEVDFEKFEKDCGIVDGRIVE